MNIRPFVREDAPGVLECLKEVWSITAITDDSLDFFLESYNYLYVVEDGEEIIGCATLHLQSKLIRNGGVAGFIEDVVVKEKNRGQGIGELLVKKLVELAKDLGCYKVSLSCFPERTEFYKRCGFFEENITMRHNL